MSTLSQDVAPEGTICLLTSETGRYAHFWISFCHLLAMCGPVHFITKMSLNIAEARNDAIREAKGQWLFFMDDDHTFSPYLLHQLLGRNVPVIQPLVLTRRAPFGPVVMGPETKDGMAHWRLALTPSLPKDGIPVDIVGAAGMLIRREVWEAIPEPWFEFGAIPGRTDVTAEDTIFCRKALKAGFQPWVDLEHTMSHMNVAEIWPVRLDDGSWVTRVIIGGAAIDIPSAEPQWEHLADGTVKHKQTGEIITDAWDRERFRSNS